LEGRYHFARSTPEALARAQECFERAVARDPCFARAYDSLAELYWYYGFFGGAPPREAFARSTWYALRAVELDDDLAETHALLAMLRKELDYNWDDVEREVNRALELNPDSPLVRLRYAISALLPHGRLDEAVAVVDTVVHTDPLSLFVRWWMGVMTFFGRRYNRAIEEGRHMVSLDPTHFLGHWVLGVALEETGAAAEAIAELEKANELSGGIPFTLGFLAMAYGRGGRHGDARALLQRLEEAAAVGYVSPMCFAFCFVGLGDWDRALAAMEEAVEARDPLVMPIKSYPFLDPVRDDPRLRSLQRRMNLG
jgi:tetratricopeptide (TPR) repeat protein